MTEPIVSLIPPMYDVTKERMANVRYLNTSPVAKRWAVGSAGGVRYFVNESPFGVWRNDSRIPYGFTGYPAANEVHVPPGCVYHAIFDDSTDFVWHESRD